MASIRSRVRYGPLLGVFALLLALPSIAQPAAESILRQIEAEGPRIVLNRLWDDQQTFWRICELIETADPKWLEVARQLKPASDAFLALSIDYCVARALPNAPERVLALIGHGFDVEKTCTSPFIEPEPGIAEEYQRRAVAALRAIRAPRLSSLVAECLAGVEVPLVPAPS